MHPRTHIQHVTLCTASDNVDSHPVLCAVEELSRSATVAACRSSHHLLDWNTYREVSL